MTKPSPWRLLDDAPDACPSARPPSRIPSPPSAVGHLAKLNGHAHLVRRRAEKLRRGWPELPRPLFCSTAGTSADPSGVRQAFRKVCTKAKGLLRDQAGADGQPKPVPPFTPHGLRHTFAALHLQAGTDVYYVSRMLGHADISLTVHTYGAWL